MALEDLPPEILLMCLEELHDPLDSRGNFLILNNVRLVCKRIAEIVTPILFSDITVRLSVTSLQRLDQLLQNPVISESVSYISIILPCYDLALVEDIFLYSWAIIRCILSMMYFMEPNSLYRERRRKILRICGKICEEWEPANSGDCDINDATHNMRLLKGSHQGYKRLCHEQQLGQQDRKPVMLLSAIFKRLKNLHQIDVLDTQPGILPCDENALSDQYWKSGFLPACAWTGDPNGSTAGKLIIDILDAMEMSSMHPPSFCLHMSTPLYLEEFGISSQHIARIGPILSNTRSMSIVFTLGAGYLYGDKCPEDLTCALCDVTALERLDLCIRRLIEDQLPQTALLPLGKGTWTHLKFLGLRGIDFEREQLQILLNKCNKDMLEELNLICLTLLSGSWKEVIEGLRSFDALKKITLKLLQGVEFRPIDVDSNMMPEQGEEEELLHRQAERYILHEIDENPLSKFVA